MPGATGPAVQCRRVTGSREPTRPPHHQIIVLLACIFPWSSPGRRCCLVIRAPFHTPVQGAGALRQPDLRPGRGKWHGGSRETTGWRCCGWLDLWDARDLLLWEARVAAACGLQQPRVLLSLQPAGGFPHQQGHRLPADQQSGAGLSAWGRGDQRRSVQTRRGTDQNREGGRRRERDEGANTWGRARDIQGGAAWMNTLRLVWDEKIKDCVTGCANRSLDWFVLEEEKAKCIFCLRNTTQKHF